VTRTRWARPYLLTGGRTFTRYPLHTHTLVSAPHYSAVASERLLPEARALVMQAAFGPLSIAELSAHTDVPLGVTRVLISDLAETGALVIDRPAYVSPFDRDLLEKVRDGLRNLV
jgi:hypothetical protein